MKKHCRYLTDIYATFLLSNEIGKALSNHWNTKTNLRSVGYPLLLIRTFLQHMARENKIQRYQGILL